MKTSDSSYLLITTFVMAFYFSGCVEAFEVVPGDESYGENIENTTTGGDAGADVKNSLVEMDDAEPSSSADSESELSSDADADSDSDTDTDSDTAADTASETAADTESENALASDTDDTIPTDVLSDPGSDTVPEADTQTEASGDSEEDSDTIITADTEAETDDETDTDAGTDTEAETDNDADSDLDTETAEAENEPYVVAGDWYGHAWTGTGSADGGTINDIEGTYTLGEDSLCAEGFLVADYNSMGVVGFNVAQEQGEETAAPWYPGINYQGLFVSLTQTTSAVIRVELMGEDGQAYCMEFSNGAGNFSWSSFQTNCWDGSGTAYTTGIGIVKVQVYAAGTASGATEYSYCIDDLYPWSSS